MLWPVVALSLAGALQGCSAAVSAGNQTSTSITACNELLHDGWMACRVTADTDLVGLSDPSTPLPETCFPATVPGTTLTTLINNGEYEDPFFEENLLKIPDISDAGKEFYTFAYIRSMGDYLPTCTVAGKRIVLKIRAATYTVQAYLNGQLMNDENGNTKSVGGYIRRAYCLSDYGLTQGADARLAVYVEPPEYPGKNISGQGGDHEMARNAGVMQCTQGWDWIAGTPDRNTGLWDEVSLEAQGIVTVADPFVHTLAADPLTRKAVVNLFVDVHNAIDKDVTGTVEVRFGDNKLHHQQQVTVKAKETLMVDLGNHTLHDIDLWWPHTHGKQPLYSVKMTFRNTDSSHSIEFVTGVRHMHTYVDKSTLGRIFEINGVRIFLEGGNWIATDQLLRFSTDKQRYSAEVRMHKEAGLNLIRVWGGGLTERPEFYEACDRLGVMVMQEFWMTGDNNGRWAGDYDWPEDHTAYMDNVKDTIRLVRPHPSLLFWCAGNELYPMGLNPPNDILDGMVESVNTLSPGVYFIPSSMGNYTDFDPSYALAPQDGPYGVLIESAFFSRNPGLNFGDTPRESVVLGFNPELGSVSTPVARSMRRMMSEEKLAKLPEKMTTWDNVDEMWQFFKYLPYNDGTYDHLYDIATPQNIDDYCAQSQVVQFKQYQALFEGYQEHMWEWYTAVVMWKSQSPWPVLRGALYDYFLEYTGGLWGARAATMERLHVQFNELTWSPTIVNKGTLPYKGGHLVVSMYDLSSGDLADTVTVDIPNVSSSSVYQTNYTVSWPSKLDDQDDLMLMDLKLYDEDDVLVLSHNQYWLSNPSQDAPNFKTLGDMRKESDVQPMTASATGRKKSKNVSLMLSNDDPDKQIAFFNILSVEATVNGTADSVRPVWYSENYFTLLPGETKEVTMNAEGWDGEGDLAVVIDGWNSGSQKVPVSF